jgi:hypothetical protein
MSDENIIAAEITGDNREVFTKYTMSSQREQLSMK